MFPFRFCVSLYFIIIIIYSIPAFLSWKRRATTACTYVTAGAEVGVAYPVYALRTQDLYRRLAVQPALRLVRGETVNVKYRPQADITVPCS